MSKMVDIRCPNCDNDVTLEKELGSYNKNIWRGRCDCGYEWCLILSNPDETTEEDEPEELCF